jgi:hypothetical protein
MTTDATSVQARSPKRGAGPSPPWLQIVLAILTVAGSLGVARITTQKTNEEIAMGRILMSLPKGTILASYNAGAPVPDGWVLCDGNFGTPELAGRVLLGAAPSEQLGKAGGDTGVALEGTYQPKVAGQGGLLMGTLGGAPGVTNVAAGVKGTVPLPPHVLVRFICKQ